MIRRPLEISTERTGEFDKPTKNGDVVETRVYLNGIPMYVHRSMIANVHDPNDWDQLDEKAIDGFFCKLRDVLR